MYPEAMQPDAPGAGSTLNLSSPRLPNPASPTMPKSLVQRLFTSIVPRSWAASMEADSRRWMMTCNCGLARSIWDLGGIRWKARGQSRNYGRCPACGKRSWHTLVWRAEPDPARPDAPPS
jgi:hypothetical protein